MTERSWRLSGALQCSLIGILVGLIWKWSFFQFADIVYTQIPIAHDFFPEVLRDATVARYAYSICVGGFSIAIILVTTQPDRHRVRTVACSIATLACGLLLLHQASYNDVTFLMVVWCGAIATWYSHRMSVDEPDELLRKAANLSRIVLSLMFLGGLVGKCTTEYWSGQVLYEIYFIDRDFWFFNWLRDRYQGDDLRAIATIYSRLVIVTEAIGSLAWGAGWLLSSRAVAILMMFPLIGIGVMSNYQLFSVLAPLIGMIGVGLLVPKQLACS